MTTTDVDEAKRRLDELIAAATRPLLDRQEAGEEAAAEELRRLGMFLCDAGCAVVNMAASDALAGAEDSGGAAAGDVWAVMISSLRRCARHMGFASVNLHDLADELEQRGTNANSAGGDAVGCEAEKEGDS